jgi:hypothetical protein
MDMEEEESDKEEWSPPNSTHILIPSCIIYDLLNLIHIQDEATARSTYLPAYTMCYSSSKSRRFKKGAIDLRPIVLVKLNFGSSRGVENKL